MKQNQIVNVDDETISSLGLQLSSRKINAQIAPNARVFEYPPLENVFIMESDLYGNRMPPGSCFLVFNGNHGLIGKHLLVKTLRNSDAATIKIMVEQNTQG